MRKRILHAAGQAFSRAGFDHVGMRDIAAAADTDAAIAMRLFGSKETLFAAVAENAFGLEPAFMGPTEGLGERIAEHLLGPKPAEDLDEFDAFQFLLRSATSPVAAPILSRHLQASFIAPLARLIGGAEAEARAGLIAAYILGFTTLRFALPIPAFDVDPPALVARELARAIQLAIDAES